MTSRCRTKVKWLDGRESVERMFDGQARGEACFYCSLSDGLLKPVGHSSAACITAHAECVPARKAAA